MTPRNITTAAAMTLFTFKDYSIRLIDNIISLRTLRQTTGERLQSKATFPTGDDPERDIQRLQSEVDSIKQRLAYFEEASALASSTQVHVVEDFSAGNNSTQIVTLTAGDLIWAKRVKAGNNALQFVGSASDDSLQKVLAAHNRQGFAENSQRAFEEKPTANGLYTSNTGGSSITE